MGFYIQWDAPISVIYFLVIRILYFLLPQAVLEIFGHLFAFTERGLSDIMAPVVTKTRGPNICESCLTLLATSKMKVGKGIMLDIMPSLSQFQV